MVYTKERLQYALEVFRESERYRERRQLQGSNLGLHLENLNKKYETRSSRKIKNKPSPLELSETARVGTQRKDEDASGDYYPGRRKNGKLTGARKPNSITRNPTSRLRKRKRSGQTENEDDDEEAEQERIIQSSVKRTRMSCNHSHSQSQDHNFTGVVTLKVQSGAGKAVLDSLTGNTSDARHICFVAKSGQREYIRNENSVSEATEAAVSAGAPVLHSDVDVSCESHPSLRGLTSDSCGAAVASASVQEDLHTTSSQSRGCGDVSKNKAVAHILTSGATEVNPINLDEDEGDYDGDSSRTNKSLVQALHLKSSCSGMDFGLGFSRRYAPGGNRTKLILHTNWAHPIEYGCAKERCSFCLDGRYALFGCGVIDVQVIQLKPGVYEEVPLSQLEATTAHIQATESSGGHLGSGNATPRKISGGKRYGKRGHRERGCARTRICDACCESRVAVARCPQHRIVPLSVAKGGRWGLRPDAKSAQLLQRFCSICISPATFACVAERSTWRHRRQQQERHPPPHQQQRRDDDRGSAALCARTGSLAAPTAGVKTRILCNETDFDDAYSRQQRQHHSLVDHGGQGQETQTYGCGLRLCTYCAMIASKNGLSDMKNFDEQEQKRNGKGNEKEGTQFREKTEDVGRRSERILRADRDFWMPGSDLEVAWRSVRRERRREEERRGRSKMGSRYKSSRKT